MNTFGHIVGYLTAVAILLFVIGAAAYAARRGWRAAGPRPTPRASGLYDCPRCTDAVVDLTSHLKTCRE